LDCRAAGRAWFGHDLGVTEPLPPEDPRDALIREQAALLKEQAEQIAALTALVAELREQRDAPVAGDIRNLYPLPSDEPRRRSGRPDHGK
jgi:hypothetical protein